jgi:hypothetical protein
MDTLMQLWEQYDAISMDTDATLGTVWIPWQYDASSMDTMMRL